MLTTILKRFDGDLTEDGLLPEDAEDSEWLSITMKKYRGGAHRLLPEDAETTQISYDVSFQVKGNWIHIQFHACEYRIPAIKSTVKKWIARLNSRFLTQYNKHVKSKDMPNPYQPKPWPLRKLTKSEQCDMDLIDMIGAEAFMNN